MAIAFLKPEALFTSKINPRVNNDIFNLVKKVGDRHLAIAVFSHHRDVKVALDELNDDGFAVDNLALIARQVQRCNSGSELITNNQFDLIKFGLNPVAQKFFSRLFERGKYLLLIDGTKHDVDAACQIVSRRRNRAKVWRFK